MDAEIIIEYDSPRFADSVAEAVSADNSGTPTNLSITTRSEGTAVITKIVCQGKLGTFIATVDDLLFSIAIAEKTLRETITHHVQGQP